MFVSSPFILFDHSFSYFVWSAKMSGLFFKNLCKEKKWKEINELFVLLSNPDKDKRINGLVVLVAKPFTIIRNKIIPLSLIVNVLIQTSESSVTRIGLFGFSHWLLPIGIIHLYFYMYVNLGYLNEFTSCTLFEMLSSWFAYVNGEGGSSGPTDRSQDCY